MKKVLLDTSAFIELLRGKKKVADIMNSADIIYFSFFVIGEILVGFRGGKKEEEILRYIIVLKICRL
jgi:predicted nucleic acid-binding protein